MLSAIIFIFSLAVIILSLYLCFRLLKIYYSSAWIYFACSLSLQFVRRVFDFFNLDDYNAFAVAGYEIMGALIPPLFLIGAWRLYPLFRAIVLKQTESDLILDSAGEGIICLKPDGRHAHVNPAAAEMLGYQPDELIGQPSHKIWHHTKESGEIYPEAECPILKSLRNGEKVVCEEFFWRKDGSSFAVVYTSTPVIVNGKIAGTVVVFRDITEQREFVNELITARIRAEAADEAKSIFLAMMSHEIRTPLTGIIGFLDLLHGSVLDDEQIEYVETAKESVWKLLDIFKRILEYASIETGKLKINTMPFDLRGHIAVIVNSFSWQVESKGLNVSLHQDAGVPELLQGDPEKIRQIVVNLLNNAAEFTKKGEIRVRVEIDREKQEVAGEANLIISIADTGIGISADKLGCIFNAFTQCEDIYSREHQGIGLGLTIANGLAEMMGGQIKVESELGKGSVFKICRLPN